jgi:hypothetical protein
MRQGAKWEKGRKAEGVKLFRYLREGDLEWMKSNDEIAGAA